MTPRVDVSESETLKLWQESRGPLEVVHDLRLRVARLVRRRHRASAQIRLHHLGLEVVRRVAAARECTLRPEGGGCDEGDLEAVFGGGEAVGERVVVDLEEIEQLGECG